MGQGGPSAQEGLDGPRVPTGSRPLGTMSHPIHNVDWESSGASGAEAKSSGMSGAACHVYRVGVRPVVAATTSSVASAWSRVMPPRTASPTTW